MNNSNFIYKGEVSLSYQNRKFVGHNVGSQALFDTFADFLAGGGYNQLLRPRYLMLYDDSANNVVNKSVGELISNNLLTGYALLSSTVEKVDEHKYATFTTTIKFPDEEGISGCIALIDGNKEKILAAHDVSGITSGSSVLIKWKMCIDNAPVPKATE